VSDPPKGTELGWDVLNPCGAEPLGFVMAGRAGSTECRVIRVAAAAEEVTPLCQREVNQEARHNPSGSKEIHHDTDLRSTPLP
jgi:hypothetical protein